jgi:hypothetical protein
MPQLSQGDVFEVIDSSRAELAVVFGHIGFNEMQQYWVNFSAHHSELVGVRDPFKALVNGPIQISKERWLWFVPEEKNHGMTDGNLVNALNTALSWASMQHIKFVTTNGVANVDCGRDTAYNLQSYDQRARFLVDYATAIEKQYGISIELISLNDVFVRMR